MADETPEQKAAREAAEAAAAEEAKKKAKKNKDDDDDDDDDSGKEAAELKAEIARLREGNRTAKADAKKLQDELDERNKKELKEQGKFKDLYEKSEADKKTQAGEWRRKYVKSITRSVAVEAGILDSDLAGLINVDDLAGSDMDEGELVEKIRTKVEEHKEKKPALYKGKKGGNEDDDDDDDDAGKPRQTGDGRRPPKPDDSKKKPKDVRKLDGADYREARQEHLRKLAKDQGRRY